MDLNLLKFLTEGGAIALSVAANVALIMWIRKQQARIDAVTDSKFEVVKECAEAMTEARISVAAGAKETNRTAETLGRVIAILQAKGGV